MTASQSTCTQRIVDITPEAAIVSNLGVASYALAGVKDRPRNFYQWGSMGLTTSLGLGVAQSINSPVTILEGDGSLLMSLGTLATVGRYHPPNLTIVVFDNRSFATTGGQSTHSDTVDFVIAAEAAGVTATAVASVDDFERAYRNAVAADETRMIVADVENVEPEDRPPFDFAHIKRRFRRSLESGNE